LAIIVAALGSSAVGAIVGGFLTTWLRGRIERDEAWRTRLLESGSALGTELSDVFTAGGRIASDLRRRIPTDEVAEDKVAELRAAVQAARTALMPVSLLFGRESPTFRDADTIVRLMRDMRRVLEGDMQRVIEGGERASLGITSGTPPSDAALALFEAAQSRLKSFADHANDEIRSAQVRRAVRRPSS
jgi:hypothetical protein